MAELSEYEPADIEIYLKDKGMVLREKSLIAFSKSDGKILAVGRAAEELAGKNIEGVQVFSPLRQGRIADFLAAARMFQSMMKDVWGKGRFRKPHVVVCTSPDMTEVEKKALEDVMYQAGAREITIYEGALKYFMEASGAGGARQYAAYDLFIAIAKSEPEKYIAEELRNILKYADQQGISPAAVEELLKEAGLRGESGERGCAASD